MLIARRRLDSALLEGPFGSRSRNMGPDQATILEKQRHFQSVHKYTHLKGPRDKITSVVIPWVLFGSAAFMMTTGLSKLYTGTGKKEGA